jgi:sialate O-acetylesterase
MKIHRRLLLSLLLIGVQSASALTLPHVFGDHMVLQSGQPVPIWGWASPGEGITVHFGAQEKHATAAAGDGRWEVRLDPLTISSQPAQLTVSGSDTVTFNDVLVGEVWLCSGQSNMEKPVGEQRGQKPTLNSVEELAAANFPEIRLLKVPRARLSAPTPDFKAAWVPCTPASLDQTKFSAAGYFFARKLYQELNIPIGVIDASYGGTRIELWISPEGFAAVPSLAEYAKAALTPPAKVDGAELSTCYRGEIYPLIPYAIRGVLWYQGESNVDVDDGAFYADKMTALINDWRSEWHQELPFYYVQLAPLLYHVARSEKVVSPEAEPRVWEAQTATLRLPHTGMIVTTDLVDDLTDIHPRDKKDVGERLARWALTDEYGRKDIEVSGPMFRSMDIQGDKAILHFDHIGGGLVSKDAKPLKWFDIAGAGGAFFPAIATIDGDTVVLTSPKVPAPQVVHFAWDEAACANLFNKAGLPAIPFRTDNPFTQAAKKTP